MIDDEYKKCRLCFSHLNSSFIIHHFSFFIASKRHFLVGLSGLEPPTSRLSGVCSNQLSYKPVSALRANEQLTMNNE